MSQVGKQWSELSAEGKKPYEEKSAVDKERYTEEVKSYMLPESTDSSSSTSRGRCASAPHAPVARPIGAGGGSAKIPTAPAPSAAQVSAMLPPKNGRKVTEDLSSVVGFQSLWGLLHSQILMMKSLRIKSSCLNQATPIRATIPRSPGPLVDAVMKLFHERVRI
jgi:hypothetical protein